MNRVFETSALDNFTLREGSIISRDTVDQTELDKKYPERIVFRTVNDDNVLVLKVGESLVVPYTNAADAKLFSVYSVLK